MTGLLEKAFKEVSKLPETDQNIFARWILAEMDAEKKWDKKFAESEDVLAQLAQEALKDDEEGRTIELDIDEL